MPLFTMINWARRCFSRVLACLSRVGKKQHKPRSRLSKKAGKKPSTCVTVRDVNKRLHTLLHVPAQKASLYVREGRLQNAWSRRIVVGYPRFPFTRSRADMWYSTWVFTIDGQMHTIRCQHNEAQRLREHSLAVAAQRGE